MVRGRRARVNDVAASSGAAVVTHTINGSHLIDDQFCASPKRKDCKIDEVTKNMRGIKATNGGGQSMKFFTTNGKTSSNDIFGTKTRSKTIKNFFKATYDKPTTINIVQSINNMNGSNNIGKEEEKNRNTIKTIDLIEDEDNTCDHVFGYTINNKTNGETTTTITTTNIFLQEPVLSLNVDKSLNQPSSIKINKTLEVDPIFSSTNGYHITLNGHFNKAVRLSSSPPKHDKNIETTNILLNYDSNSCDSGVVIDNKLELSPSRRRKPTTPHRILCPSPVKHASIEKSPSSASLVNFSIGNGIRSPDYVNGVVQMKNSKSRRRLNSNESENNSSSIKSPQLVGGVILTDETYKKINSNSSCNQNSKVLNSAINPTAVQNTNNNYKKRTNGHHQQRQSKHQELTDFFPVRRSVRKTKRAVQEEIMRSIEKAIIEGREDGLKIENFEGKGRGVVAERLFKRGEFVVEYIGDLIAMGEANQREKKYSLDENAGCYMYYFKHRNQQYCIDATAETGKLGRLVNHSRNGNLITKVVVIKNHPHLVLIAKDDIQSGEELTYDYGDRSKEALLHHPWLAL